MAQTAETGALTGTVTDPSGAIIAGASVTVTNLATGQSRVATTDANGSYKFSLLPPGNYSLKFSAGGFKTAEVSPVTVNVTETPVVDRSLAVGAESEQITVQSTQDTIQTQNATNGGLVGSQEVNELPLVTRNYTQIVDLSPGVVTNVSNAAAVGNGTQDVSANGSKANQNNYSMDGASIVNYASGTAGQTGSYPGIAIPNPDTIQEFKVQTSQYDAGYGRDPGVNVEVITKGGSNDFHGDAFEYFRNNFLNANDFFYKHSELESGQPNTPQILKQNTFGGTLGGPIKKDKIFFFGAYQGFRQINGIGTTGFASGYESATVLLPWSDPNDPTDPRHLMGPPTGPGSYRAYLGSVFGPTGPCPAPIFSPAGTNNCNTGLSTGLTVAPDGSNISNTALALLQAPGILKGGYNQGFYFPSAPANCKLAISFAPSSGCPTAISLPTHANENQYMANSDIIINNKNTLSERYFYSSDPQVQSFLCFITPNSCNPGAPEDVTYTSHTANLKLTTVVSNSMVNQARVTYQRNVEDANDPNTLMSCDLPNGATIIPLINNGAPCPAVASPFKEFNVVPILDILGIASPSGGWGQGGNFSATSTNYINTFQWGDQLSWNHGIHSLRFGFDGERVLYNNTIPASGRGEVLFDSVADFLTSSSGLAVDGTPPTAVVPGCGSFCGGGATPIGLKGLLTHNNDINSFDWFVQDDIKVNRKLTVNVGLRWEYDGFPDDKSGQFSDVWASQAAKLNAGSYFLNGGATLLGFVVPSNFDVKQFGLVGPDGETGVLVNSNKTLIPGTPLDNFAPRLGVAWQPLGDKFVVRAGYGWFYDRLYGSLLIDNQLNEPPYSATTSGSFPLSLSGTLHDPYAAVAGIPLEWTPRTLQIIGPPGSTANNSTVAGSNLTYTSDSPQLANRLPMTQEYNLDLQYELPHGWIADIGYVGTHSIHVFNWSQDVNIAPLVAGAPNEPSDTMNANLIRPVSSFPYNDPANTQPVTVNTTTNTLARVSYLGFAPTGLATTNTNGDSVYNSLQAQIRHQFAHGLLFQASYTWSKDLTNVDTSEAGSGIQEPGQVTNGASNSNNPLDLVQQYGPAAFNRSQRFVASYSYDLPWKNTEGFTGKLLGGWTVSGVTTVQNGEPFTITDSLAGTIYGTIPSRAALADPVDCSASTGNCNSATPIATSGSSYARVVSGLNGGASWVNPAAFTSLNNGVFGTLLASSPYCIGGTPNPGGSSSAICGSAGSTFPGAGTGFGNSKIGSIVGPGQFNWDLSLIKNTKVTEWGTLQFRAEFYNIWNHPQFNPPAGVDISTPATFGLVDSSSVTPRIVQFALKFLF